MEKEKIKYVIHPATFGETFIITKMTDGIHSDNTGMTIEEIRKDKGIHDLLAVTSEQMNQAWDNYESSLCKPFREVTEERYYFLMNCIPPKRFKPNSSFFVGEYHFGSTYCFCFRLGDRYFTGLRSIRLTDQELDQQIAGFKRYLDNPTEEEINLYHPNIEHTDPDNLQFCLPLSDAKYWYCQFDDRQFYEAPYTWEEEMYNKYKGNPEKMLEDAVENIEVQTFIADTSNWISKIMDASHYSEEFKKELLDSYILDWDEYTEAERNQLACEIDFEVNTLNL